MRYAALLLSVLCLLFAGSALCLFGSETAVPAQAPQTQGTTQPEGEVPGPVRPTGQATPGVGPALPPDTVVAHPANTVHGLELQDLPDGSAIFLKTAARPEVPDVLQGDTADIFVFRGLGVEGVTPTLGARSLDVRRGNVDHVIVRADDPTKSTLVYLIKAVPKPVDWTKRILIRDDGILIRLPAANVVHRLTTRDGEIVLDGEGLEKLESRVSGRGTLVFTLPGGGISRFLPLDWQCSQAGPAKKAEAQAEKTGATKGPAKNRGIKSVKLFEKEGVDILEVETDFDLRCRNFDFTPGARQAVLRVKPLPDLPRLEISLSVTLGKKGYTDEDLFLPSAVTAGPEGFFVADTFNHRIKLYSPAGKIIKTVGKYGIEPGTFNQPVDVALDNRGNIYVADMLNNRIVKFNRDLGFMLQWGGHGDKPGRFRNPQGLAVSNTNQVYVSDLSHRVQVFDEAGKFLRLLGGPGRKPGQFAHPVGLAFDEKGNLYVADTGNKRVQKFDASGRYVEQWQEIAGWGRFGKPCALRSIGGLLYVLDQERNEIVIIDECGRLVRSLKSDFEAPAGISVSDGKLAVADRGHHTLKIFDVSQPRVGGDLR